MIRIITKNKYTKPPTAGGDQDTWDLLLMAFMRSQMARDGNNYVMDGGDYDVTRLNDVKKLINKADGIEIEGYEVWFELSDITLPCPFADQNPVDDDGNPVPIKTWEQWGTGPNNGHAPVEISGKWYRSNLRGASGEPLKASLWAQYITTPADGIVQVMSVEDFVAIPRPDPTP